MTLVVPRTSIINKKSDPSLGKIIMKISLSTDFNAKGLTKKFKCVGCINMLLMPRIENLPERCEVLLDMINRIDLIKPSDIIYM